MNECIKWVSNSKNFDEFDICMAKAQGKTNQKQIIFISISKMKKNIKQRHGVKWDNLLKSLQVIY